ncbi:unnamed protein product [Didymodactylos carnosus]|uniref:Uncharacterized protein n=1 Tax=Didymodactylos carnosus TaxID=1234261 RepID=A0A815C8G2_9BILA|nr:unnamed protein product [Didymodactylos carnosus]CAF1355474.1 unnamed protein product [Didymodactylos carnosus]CAF4069392.1 unnamed protein product [Didymodactylos carnosus]CAF4165781.1 unnamed protein product [Didymodactylos carnosus]
MNAQNIVSTLSDLVSRQLSSKEPSPITSQERQMAEYLADIVKLMVSGQKVDYDEETIIDFAGSTDEEDSEEEEQHEDGEVDEDRTNKELLLEKYDLKSFSEDFMRQIIDFVDHAGPGSKHGRSWKASHHSFRTIPNRHYIPHFRKYLEHHGTKKQKTQNLNELLYKKLIDAREKSLAVHDLDIQRWGLRIAREIKLEEFRASHG